MQRSAYWDLIPTAAPKRYDVKLIIDRKRLLSYKTRMVDSNSAINTLDVERLHSTATTLLIPGISSINSSSSRVTIVPSAIAA